KPDPEIFLLANQKLGTAKKETLILEDSQNGILAASAAEIPVVMVPDLLPPSQELIKKTAGVVSSLHEIPALIK
ncbi:HAD-IA family hydrolase, partial [Enterococcus faecium]